MCSERDNDDKAIFKLTLGEIGQNYKREMEFSYRVNENLLLSYENKKK